MGETLANHSEQVAEAPKVKVERPQAAEYTTDDKAERVAEAQAAVTVAETSATERPAAPQLPVADDRPLFIDNAIKTLRLRKNLTHVQSKLKPAQKALSKVVHQPLVSLVSDTSAKTVSRPSGLLGGGIVAFAGSLAYVYLAHHIGFSYNYFLFFVLFVGGFALGLLGELIVRMLRPRFH